jgi:hypothetical protein
MRRRASRSSPSPTRLRPKSRAGGPQPWVMRWHLFLARRHRATPGRWLNACRSIWQRTQPAPPLAARHLAGLALPPHHRTRRRRRLACRSRYAHSRRSSAVPSRWRPRRARRSPVRIRLAARASFDLLGKPGQRQRVTGESPLDFWSGFHLGRFAIPPRCLEQLGWCSHGALPSFMRA